MKLKSVVYLFYLLVFTVILTRVNASSCSRSLPSYNETTLTGDVFTGGIQLLIPSWTFSCNGTIDQWYAYVTGNTTIDNSIEFQVFEPDPIKDNVYHVVYGNSYREDGPDDSRINVTADNVKNIFLPIRAGYIVGVYIRPDIVNQLHLLYEDTGNVDIYYWENVTKRDCDLSLCNAKIIKGINPLIGWIFRDADETLLLQYESILAAVKQANPNYCTEAQVSTCSIIPTISSTVTSSILPSSSTTGITILPITDSTISMTSKIADNTISMTSKIADNTMSMTSEIADNTMSMTFETTTTTTSQLSMFSSSSFMSTTITSLTPSPVITLSTTPMINPPSTPAAPNNGIFANLSTEALVTFGVVIFLFLLVIILILTICLCCLLRRKTVVEVSVAQAFDNPDYNGIISMGSVKKQDELLTSISIKNDPSQPLPHIPNQQETALASSHSQRESYNHYSTTEMQNSIENHAKSLQLDTQKSPSTTDTVFTSSTRELSTSPIKDGFVPSPHLISNIDTNKNEYSVPRPVKSQESDSGYHNCPPPPQELPPSCPTSHYYSMPTVEDSGQFIGLQCIYDSVDELETSVNVPSIQDPEVVDEYDVTVVREQQKKAATRNNEGSVDTTNTKGVTPSIYAFVPTEEQRILHWRYEMPLGQGYDKLKYFIEKTTFWAPASTQSGLYDQLASNKYREIPREEIEINKTIGEGQFGYVSKGIWISPDGRHEVAIKMLKPDATEEDRLKLLQEAAIMGQFSHKNVVKLHGVVTIGDPVMIILEFMPRGDLRTYLRSIKQQQQIKINAKISLPGLPKLLLKFCRDIADGMNYLASKSFVHRDLAARNILFSSQLTCKIGDFGMARDLMEDENNYYKSRGGIIPLKWTAPEALNFKKYTSASDVWSYGMVLYEIWSLGNKPFNDLSNPIVIALVNSKHCQPPPPGCSRSIYQLMVNCWNPEHTLRPSFADIITYLDKSDEILLLWNNTDKAVGKKVHILGAPLEEAADLYIDLQRVYQQSMLEEFQRGRSKSTNT